MSGKGLVGTIGQYGGEFIDLLEVELNREFWVRNGGYTAYVIEEDGVRFLIIPDAPSDMLIKQIITADRRYSLEVEMSSIKNTGYTECDCCGRRIKLGRKVYRIKGSDYAYCSIECFNDIALDVCKLTEEIVETCGKEIKLG